MAVYIGLGREEADGDLFSAHFEAEYACGVSLTGGVSGHVERERALAQAGTGGENDEVGTLESAAKKFVHAGEASYDRRQGNRTEILEGAALLHVLVEENAEVGEVTLAASALDTVEDLLGLGEDVVGVGAADVSPGPLSRRRRG